MRARVPCLAPLALALALAAGSARGQECPADLTCVPPGQCVLCEGDVIGTDIVPGSLVRVHRPSDPSGDGGILALPGGTPEGVTVDPRGFPYWTDSQLKQVLRINLETTDAAGPFDLIAPDPLSLNPFRRLEDLEFSPDGSRLAVIDATANPAIAWDVDPITGALGVLMTETDLIGPFRPSIPQGIAFDPWNPEILYIADGSATRGGVYRVDLSDGLSDPVPITDHASRALLDGPGGSPIPGGEIQVPYDVEVFDPTPDDNTTPDHVLLVSNQPYPDLPRFDDPSDSKVFVVTNPWSVEFVPEYDADDQLIGGELVGGEAYVLLSVPDLTHPLGLGLADEEGDDGVADRLWVADLLEGRFQRFPIDVAGGAVSAGGPTSFDGYDRPWGLHVVGAITPAERQPFVVLDRRDPQDGRLVRLTPDVTDPDAVDDQGNPIQTFNISTADLTEIVQEPDLLEPVGICVDETPGGLPFYVATDRQRSYQTPDLVEIVEAMDPDPASAVAFGLPPNTLVDATRIRVDAEGHYLVLDRDRDAHTGRIVRIARDGSWVEDYLTSDYRDADGDPVFYEPAAFDFDADGVLVVANTSSDPDVVVEEIPPLLRVLPDLGGELVNGERVFPLPVNDATWIEATDMVIDQNGDALVLDQENPAFGSEGAPGILRVSAASGRVRLKSYTSVEFDRLNGIALDATRELLVSEGGTPGSDEFPSRVLRVDPVIGAGGVREIFDYVDVDSDELVVFDFETADGIAVDAPSPAPPLDDLDRDGFGPSTDNCEPTGADLAFCTNSEGPPCHNPDQSDVNNNGIGDVCERNDPDGDGFREIPGCDPHRQDCGPDEDNCPIYAGLSFCPDPTEPERCSTCTDAASCANPDQKDSNLDGLGDVCQPDDPDEDGIPNTENDPPDICQGGNAIDCLDNCPGVANSDQADFDDDAQGDACEDSDGDGVLDADDNCPENPDPDQTDTDGDGQGDLCDADVDGDEACDDPEDPDCDDNCSPFDDEADCSGIGCANPTQANLNGPDDRFGDVCQPHDADGDGWPESDDPPLDPGIRLDNCSPGDPAALCDGEECSNPGQDNVVSPETDLGDHCEDSDGDTVLDIEDNCPTDPNPGQEDLNSDGQGDVCQNDDADGDGIPASVPSSTGPCTPDGIDPFCVDNCPDDANPDQADADLDGTGDACEGDDDDDGVLDGDDNCPFDANADQTDSDGDGFGNRCDMDLAGGDNRVGIRDFIAFGGFFGEDVAGTPGEDADANADGFVGIPDFIAFADRFGRCAGDAELPDLNCAPDAASAP